MAKKTKNPSAKKAQKNTAKVAMKPETPAPRKLKKPQYQSFRLQKRIRTTAPKLKGGFKLLKSTIRVLLSNWKPFAIILVIYTLLYAVLVQNFGNVDIKEAKTTLEQLSSGGWGRLASGFSLFGLLIGASNTASTEAAGFYQFTILFTCSLAIVWTLREVIAGHKVRARDGFYRGMYPLVPVLLVMAMVLLQLLPLVIGTFLYNVAGPTATNATGVEWLLWSALLFLLVLLSLYMLCSSLFALYIACLPGMQPMAALRSARRLVKYRRWMVMLRILFLPLVLFSVSALIMIPVLLFLTPAAVWVFFVIGVLSLPVVHGYMYALYRELLHEA